LHGKPIAEQEIGKQLLHETVSFAETSVCRRKYILHYFGEEFDETRCDSHCDKCKDPREKFEGKEMVQLFLKAVVELKQIQKARYVCNFLSGVKASDIVAYKHDKSPLFAKGDEHDIIFWNAVSRQCLVSGLLNKEIESYGNLKLTEKGKDFIENPKPFFLLKEHDYSAGGDDIISNQKGANAADDVIFKMLLDLRKKLSQDKNVPPFVIFQEPSLHDMAIQYPISIEEMTNIQGVGQGKALRYGKPFIELIANYVEENNIDRPQDFVVKSLINKSGLKVHIIKNVDIKMPLDVIASSHSKEIDEIIDEIEAIVASGTKINIDYYINDILDDEEQEEIYDYFREAETDNLDEAHSEFDGDYDEDQLRLMRIKFMSEMGN
jgi:ATP-dependent DNA helicase RecQ